MSRSRKVKKKQTSLHPEGHYEHTYESALYELEQLVPRIQDSTLKNQTRAVIDAANQLKADGEDIEGITDRLLFTTSLLHSTPGLDRRLLLEAYERDAKEAQGKPSLGWKLLGGAMIALGAACAAFSAVLLIVPPTTLLGVIGLAASTGVMGFGVGFICTGSRRGLNRAMHGVEKAVEAHDQEAPLLSAKL